MKQIDTDRKRRISKKFRLNFSRCVKRDVGSASGRRLSRFQQHKATGGISIPTPPALSSRYSFIHLGEERHRENRASCPRKQHNVPCQGSNPDHSRLLRRRSFKLKWFLINGPFSRIKIFLFALHQNLACGRAIRTIQFRSEVASHQRQITL